MRYSARWLAPLMLLMLCACSTTSPAQKAGVDRSQAVSSIRPAKGDLVMAKDLPAPLGTQGGREQLLAPDDILQIDVFQVDMLDRTVQIDANGQISLPLIGTVRAAGKSVQVLEREVAALYGAQYLQSPIVTIFVKQSFGQRVTINGEVSKAGIYPVSTQSTLMEAIAQAGGLKPVADTDRIFLYRSLGEQKVVANYNLDDIMHGRSSDPRVYGGDVVVVFSSRAKVALANLKEALGITYTATRLSAL